ncbi:hypothetical protein SDC9_68842 [bioreactor metagenome]|uniref:GmrSD restriction endonucleases N-terminal domain-containing protein n=1 Tax=bioreactor metagenome TaxID=1076179 RepID=A0A644Y1J6_9ZZZZ
MEEYQDQMPMKAFAELKGYTFHIPYQQRGYKWAPQNVRELLKDLWEFVNSDKKMYCLQPLAVVRSDDENYVLLDGQQRLTTLFLLYKYLNNNEDPYTFEFKRDNESGVRWKYLQDIESPDKEKVDSNIDFFFINRAYCTIKDWFSEIAKSGNANDISESEEDCTLENVKEKFQTLLNAGKDEKSIQLIWYEVENEKQHEVFRSLNSGKVHLTNTELIKALLLNRVSGLPDGSREEAAIQFEMIERAMQDDHFWYMLRSEPTKRGQTRMDLLFNLVARTSNEDYEKDFRTSFRWFSDSTTDESLVDKWIKVRHTFLRLKDIYSNIEAYHYIGFLTYEGSQNGDKNSYKPIVKILELHRDTTKRDFINELRKSIRKIMNGFHESIDDFLYYDSSKKGLRLLFLLHNIETILERYNKLKANKDLELKREFEQFPFELLHKQSWDIEHIASQTNSSFKNIQDRSDWLESIRTDYKEYFEGDENDADSELGNIKKKLLQYEKTNSAENFMVLYNAVITYHDKKMGESITEEEKNKVGNLVLLDSHTNRSFHNSLFPRKRRIVIIADGLKSAEDKETGIKSLFIPICTRQCFTKSYSKASNTTMNAWLKSDAEAYRLDLIEKLCDDPVISGSDSEKPEIIRFFKHPEQIQINSTN